MRDFLIDVRYSLRMLRRSPNFSVTAIVQQRTKEIGVRIALGADPTRIRNMIVSQGMRLTLVAVTIGIAGAYGLTRLMTRFLFGVSEHDSLVFVVVPLVVGAAALVAVWLPARTIAGGDTIRALRSE